MTVHILHDNRNISRYELLIEELKRQKISEYKIWDAILTSDVISSISLGQKQIVQYAKDNNLDEVCLFEDDVYFPNEKGWEYFLMNKPKEYSIYLGGSYWIDDRSKYIPRLVKVNQYVGHHCIFVHNSYYDTFLSTPIDKHIDTAQSGLGVFYLCYPMAAIQRAGFSANNMGFADYNSALLEQDIYK